jgi:hypothetical protein
LQDESGNAIGGINTDDEPVPAFVHRAGNIVIAGPSQVPGALCKGFPSCHPDVTMRLETPVIYFHPPKNAAGNQTASVHVTFHGGRLSEFFPDAVFTASGTGKEPSPFDHLFSDAESGLDWNGLQIGGDWPVTETAEHVWTAPRAVQCATVQTTNSESEKFLFYRGVGHIDAPLRVSRDAASGELLLQSQLEQFPFREPLPIKYLCLVDIQPGGNIAFRTLPSVSLTGNPKKFLAHTPASFTPSDYDPGNMEKLKASLLSALVADGLFDDEAEALLNTWELSYFKSAGLRLFFLVPRAWTEYYLPLEISQPADIHRVMVGRIEVVTPRQRDILEQISGISTNAILHDVAELGTRMFNRFYSVNSVKLTDSQMRQMNLDLVSVYSGRKPLSSFVTIPRTYQAYLDLGRFRNALILDQAKHRPTQGLTNFIASFRLEAFPLRTNSVAAPSPDIQVASH